MELRIVKPAPLRQNYRHSLYLTGQFPIEFNPEAQCPQYDQFIRTALPDPEQQDMWHEICGYAFLRDTRYQTAFLLMDCDLGVTGKSTAAEILQRLLGRGNYSNLSLHEITAKFNIAKLQDKHLNVSTEVDVRDYPKDAVLKQLISGAEITVQRKYRDPFPIIPYAKLLITANRFPRTHDRGDPFFRRWKILVFGHQFPKPGEPGNIPRFATSLPQTELNGVFLHALQGLKRLHENRRFSEPESSRQAIEDYRRSQNPVMDFVAECIRVSNWPTDMSSGAYLKDLNKQYREWCENMGHQSLAYRNFRRELEGVLKRKALKDKHIHKLCVPGVSIIPEAERQEVA